jgi:hypothetical protein
MSSYGVQEDVPLVQPDVEDLLEPQDRVFLCAFVRVVAVLAVHCEVVGPERALRTGDPQTADEPVRVQNELCSLAREFIRTVSGSVAFPRGTASTLPPLSGLL